MSESSDKIIRMVLQHEGGLVDHPRDPGGITKFGISLRSYPSLGREGIRNLTVDDAVAIYQRDYWSKVRGDDFHPAISCVIMDAGVNSGVSRAIRWAELVSVRNITGKWSSSLIREIQYSNPADFVDSFCDARLNFLRKLKTFNTFGRGWTRRVEETRAFAHALIYGGVSDVTNNGTADPRSNSC